MKNGKGLLIDTALILALGALLLWCMATQRGCQAVMTVWQSVQR